MILSNDSCSLFTSSSSNNNNNNGTNMKQEHEEDCASSITECCTECDDEGDEYDDYSVVDVDMPVKFTTSVSVRHTLFTAEGDRAKTTVDPSYRCELLLDNVQLLHDMLYTYCDDDDSDTSESSDEEAEEENEFVL